MSDLITASRLRASRKCARLERYRYRDGWRTRRDPEALTLGTLVHRGLEAWWTHGTLDAALAAMQPPAEDWSVQIRAEEMVRGYHERWQHERLEVIGVEEEFEVPLVDPWAMLPHMRFRLAGKIDARIRTDRGVVIVEHKTSSMDLGPTSDYWLQLQMDSQLSAYMIGAESLGESPVGCLYDVLRKPAIRPLSATPEHARKYTKQGALYANQRDHDETPNEYRERVRATITPDYYVRKEIARDESQLADFLADAVAEAETIAFRERSGHSPRNPDACFAMGVCPFWSCCTTGADPESFPDIFERVDRVHAELSAVESEAVE